MRGKEPTDETDDWLKVMKDEPYNLTVEERIPLHGSLASSVSIKSSHIGMKKVKLLFNRMLSVLTKQLLANAGKSILNGERIILLLCNVTVATPCLL